MLTLLIKFLKLTYKILKYPTIFVGIYFLCYLIGSNYTVNNTVVENPPVEIFISSNGVHTDLIFPVRHELIHWDTVFKVNTFKAVDSGFKYIGMGWGDKGFYLETPTWSELKASTAFKAMFFLGTSAMHISYHKNVMPASHTKSIRISIEQYQKLIHFYKSAFENEKNKPELIEGKGYTNFDNFYEAKSTYSLFNTCNIFTNNALKNAGIKAPLWSPLAGGLMKHY